MSTRHRIPGLVGAVCTAALLAGCSTSGTIGSQGSSGGKGGFVGGASAGTSGGTGGTSTGTSSDPGCNQALLAIQGAERAQNSSNPQTALEALNLSIGQLHGAAASIQKPGGKDAINKVADDLQNILNQAQSGKTPDTSQALSDAQVVAKICGA